MNPHRPAIPPSHHPATPPHRPPQTQLIEAQEWGPSAPRIPPSEAKNRLAAVTAAKAVAMALCPGIEPIKFVSMWSRRRGQVRGRRRRAPKCRARGRAWRVWGSFEAGQPPLAAPLNPSHPPRGPLHGLGLVQGSPPDPLAATSCPSPRHHKGPYIEFDVSEESLDPNWHPEEVDLMDYKTNFKVRALVKRSG